MMLCCIASFAQNSNEHLTFKGVPLDGTLKEFVSKMESKGFTYVNKLNSGAVMQGDFAGYSDCILLIGTLQNLDIVNSAGIYIHYKDYWFDLEKTYQTLKTMLIKKYGRPYESFEEFEDSDSQIDDTMKMLLLKRGKCNYKTTFNLFPKGFIILSINNLEGSYSVSLCYYDWVGTGALETELMDDL